jgi:pimeloyl-ACP methyl ester carboxylesterase
MTINDDCDGAAAMNALVYVPTDRRAIGGYLLAHGLNPQGPDDPRCDRFARILAHAGFVVMVPRLEAFTQLRVDAGAAAHLSRALRALIALPEYPRGVRPGLFSISFGSFPALLTAASPDVGHLLGSLVVFGGYANFVETCRFMMGTAGAEGPAPDPTCMVGLALNVAPVLFVGDDERRLTTAWRAYVKQVWAAPDMKDAGRLAAVAGHLAADLPPGLVETFLQGCGVQPGFAIRVEEALSRIDTAALDPRARLHAVQCPVHLFHGRNDDVIPCAQMHALAAGLTAARPRTYLTGLYDHSRQESGPLSLQQVPALAGEVTTMAAMVHAMVISGTRTKRRSGASVSAPLSSPQTR